MGINWTMSSDSALAAAGSTQADAAQIQCVFKCLGSDDWLAVLTA